MSDVDYAIVIPTVGRPSLGLLLGDLAAQSGPPPTAVVVVDDRPIPQPPLEPGPALGGWAPIRVVPGLGRGPAAARNLGADVSVGEWIAFLDDDVRVGPAWSESLARDLAEARPGVAGVQGRVEVPLPVGRRPTDWERSTAGLATAHWITADLVLRRSALLDVHGFDERFPRAYREDADLALRLRRAGWDLDHGSRTTTHPVRPATRGTSLRVQRGNADDALMRRLHGRSWRRDALTGRGRLPWHVATVSAAATAALAGLTAAGAAALGPRSRAARRGGWLAAGAGACWLALTTDFARRRILPGPRDRREVTEMLWTSAAIPVAALWHRARGEWLQRRATPWPPPLRAVLFDRDGTLVHDVPYNGDPAKVSPVPQANSAVRRLREKGLLVGVVSNQSGVARGLLSHAQVEAVNAEIDQLIGPFDTWQVCPHAPDDGCACRKPRPGLLLAAASALGVRPEQCALIGDIGSDVLAARAAGSRAVLVPTRDTLPDEVADAPWVASDLDEALDLLLARSSS